MGTVNVLGHAAGAVLFGIFLSLAALDRTNSSSRNRMLSLLAAGLAMLWNLASLCLYLPGLRPWAEPVLSFLAYAALSILPAVLLDLSLDGRLPFIVRLGYGLGLAAASLHGAEWVTGVDSPHRLALLVSSALFGALTVAAGIRLWREQHVAPSRLFGAMALFLLALTFPHFDDAAPHPHSALELVLHHASLPLALFILLQDYRFVLLDAFVRFLANVFLAGGFATAGWLALERWDVVRSQPLAITLGASGLLLYAVARGRLQEVLSRLAFGRSHFSTSLESLRRLASRSVEGEVFLAKAGQLMADQFGAEPMRILDRTVPPAQASLITDEPGLVLVVPLRLGLGQIRCIGLGRRQGGRRYLSEDFRELDQFAKAIEGYWEQFREESLRRLVSQAELRALQSQINPHFLFNALNTLYGVIPRQASAARRLVLNLADIFRYFLHNERTMLPLGEEMRIVEAYLEIEALRLGDKLRTELSVEPEARSWLIPALSIQPLVENAVKHGVAPFARPGWIRVEAKIEEGALYVAVEDSGDGPGQSGAVGEGIGFENVQKRLALCYGPGSRAVFTGEPGHVRVSLRIPGEMAVRE